MADVVIVGNGVLGLSLARALAKARLRTTVVGPEQRTGSASEAAGAMLGCFGEVTAATLKSEPGRARLRLAVAARRLWDGHLAELSEHRAGQNARIAAGTVVLLNAAGVREVDDRNFAAIRTALAEHGEHCEELAPDAIDWIAPDPAVRPLQAIHLQHEHAINPGLLLAQLRAQFLDAGGSEVPSLAVRLLRSAGAVSGVALDTGETLSARHVVLAAGAGTQALIETLPDIAAPIPPLCSGFGTAVVLQAGAQPGHVVRTPNRAFGCGLHAVPRGNGQVYVGATNVVEADVRTQAVVQDIVALLGAATRQLRRDLWGSEVRTIRTGNRPLSLDGFPLLGPTALDGLWLLTGTNRDGLHLSPLLAQELARWIMGGKPHPDVARFAPVRAPIEVMSREEAVSAAGLHMIATGYEADWSLPSEWPSLLTGLLQERFAAVAAGLSDRFTPPPEILSGARTSPRIAHMLRAYYAAVENNAPSR
jgi:glycine/D-amino acid oxidase-like deaminating enzyme